MFFIQLPVPIRRTQLNVTSDLCFLTKSLVTEKKQISMNMSEHEHSF